jgi:diamine N-acetyltransferase
MLRKITKNDESLFMQLSDEFYHSDAVLEPIPTSMIQNTFNELIRSEDYLECFILEFDNKPAGYALLSKSFSPEAGGKVVWFEEVYVRSEFQGNGLGKEVFNHVFENIDAARYRLEVEEDNERAISLYKRLGYDFLPYMQMIRDIK